MDDHEEKKKKLQKSYFEVMGLCCSSEVGVIHNILNPLDGIKHVSVIVPSRTLIVLHDNLLISPFQILKALNEARLEASMRVYGSSDSEENEKKKKKKWPRPYAIGSGILVMVSLLKYVYSPFQYVALAAVALSIFPIILKAIASLRSLRLDINILIIIAVAGTIALKDYLEAGTIVFLFSIAEWLEARASYKASAAMSSLMNMAPQKATIAETGEVVDADDVKLNTIVAVKAGELIPIDGIVVDGICEVDEKTLTGESFPVPKQNDSIVWAGTINLNGYISVKTTALAEDCVVAKMTKLVEEAQNSKTRTQRLIDKFAKFYTPAVVIISTLLAVVPVVLTVHNVKHWFHFALVVLVSACPCALVLSTPVVTFCAYTKAATSGLLIKGGDYLETLAKIKVMAFDKTGTITKGEFEVTNFQSLCDDVDLKTLLYWVSSIETKSSHPLAAAIVDYGKSLCIEPKPENVVDFENFPGEGIRGKIDERDVYIGNRKIAARAGSETVPALQHDSQGGKTTGYIYSGAAPIGFFSLTDACRTGAQEAIRELKLFGIKTSMLTGDSQAAAMQAQEQLGHALEVVHAELLPEGKVKIITEFKKEGPTAMVGDGVNDAPALATADIGISMGISGSALASETGNIILMSNDIRKIPQAVKLARKSHRKVIENVILSVVTKAAIIGLAFAGHPLVWAAVLADVGTCLLVIGNSMLLLRREHKHGGKCCKSSTPLHLHKSGCNAHNGKSSSHHHHDHHSHHHKHDHCEASDEFHEPKHSHHGRCDKSGVQSHDMENQGCSGSQNMILSGADKVASVLDNHGSCLEHNNSSRTLHCHDRNCDTITHDGATLGSPCQQFSNRHCHLITGCENPKRKTSRCDHEVEHQNPGLQSDSKKHKEEHISVDIDCEHVEPTSMHACESSEEKEQGSCCQSCPDKGNESPFVCARVTSNEREVGQCCKGSSNESPEFPIAHACISLGKREMGGCCKSYLKECCGKHGHLGAGFGGGLSEVITEQV